MTDLACQGRCDYPCSENHGRISQSPKSKESSAKQVPLPNSATSESLLFFCCPRPSVMGLTAVARLLARCLTFWWPWYMQQERMSWNVDVVCRGLEGCADLLGVIPISCQMPSSLLLVPRVPPAPRVQVLVYPGKRGFRIRTYSMVLGKCSLLLGTWTPRLMQVLLLELA